MENEHKTELCMCQILCDHAVTIPSLSSHFLRDWDLAKFREAKEKNTGRDKIVNISLCCINDKPPYIEIQYQVKKWRPNS